MSANHSRWISLLLVAAISLFAAPTAYADGPLIVDPNARAGYHFGPDPVPVYYDLGDFADLTDWSTGLPVPVVLGNDLGAQVVRNGFAAWSSVPTTSLNTQVLGDFSLKGLPQIDSTNVGLIIGTSNGRGIYVIFDADGSILANYLGAPDGVLGVSSPQFTIDGTNIVTESWTVLNGASVDPLDTGAVQFQGVATHEFGHALGLAHAQLNGAAVFYNDGPGPDSCSVLPYAGTPARGDIETMYPYIDPTAVTGTGAGQGWVHTLDSMAGISDLYPGAGWPDAYGTIEGKVFDIDGRSELTGVNVIARDLDSPYVGGNSAVTGQLTQGLLGPDGSFVLHGLIPGHRYVVYVDAILAGGFPTPPMWFLPGAERFYVRDAEADDHGFDPCRYSVITAKAGVHEKLAIRFELRPGSPRLFQLGYAAGVTGLSGDGSIAVGGYGRGGPVFRWTEQTGVVPFPNVVGNGDAVSISHDGRFIAADLLDAATDTSIGAYRWDASNGWLVIDPLGACGTDTTANFAIDDHGAVYGLAYQDCLNYSGFKWLPGRGSVAVASPGTKADGTPANTRINKVSADGRTYVGWQEDPVIGLWEGVVWNEGKPSVVLAPNGDFVDEILSVSPEGKLIGGALLLGDAPVGDGFLRAARGGPMKWIDPLPGDASPASPNAISRNGAVVVGFSGNPFLSFNPAPFIWTRGMGTANLDDFVRAQGTSMEQWSSLWEPTAISDDGRTIGGWGLGFQYFAGWVLRIDTVLICHRELTNGGSTAEAETERVGFPEEFDRHMAHGDTFGRCP